MKLLDKIAKRLGYVPAETLIKPQVIKQDLPVKTFASSIAISRYDLNYARAEQVNWHKIKLIEAITNELVSYMNISEEVDRDGNIILRGRIRVIDDGLKEF